MCRSLEFLKIERAEKCILGMGNPVGGGTVVEQTNITDFHENLPNCREYLPKFIVQKIPIKFCC